MRELRLWTRDLAAVAGLTLFVILFLFQPFRVEGTSMYPELQNQERIIVNKLAYRMGPIRRGDLVIFRYPQDPGKTFVKRVIGLPGETIRIRRGTIYLNGRPFEEPYLPPGETAGSEMAPVAIPGDCYFVMGDHRSTSNDSRYFGPVPESYISGRADFRCWPPGRLGALP